jgi:prepilin-type N-terminal cleavage/methylation domain-containing protein
VMRIFPAPISQKNRGSERAFTLLELLIVILLISIFLTFASVNWSGTQKQGSDALLDGFSIAVSLLKEEAISKYEDRVIEFDITGGKVLFGYIDQKQGFTGMGEIPLSKGYLLKDVVVNGEKFSMGKGYATVSASGMTDRTIVHFEGGDQYYSLSINPLTAKTTGERGYIEETPIK